MAGDIKGITIKLGADSTQLTAAINKVDSALKKTKASLKDINRLLKLDPTNTELLRQKQKQLKEAIQQTNLRLEALRAEQANVAKGSDKWDELQRDIIETEQKLKQLEKEYRNFGSVAAQQVAAVGRKMQEVGGKITSLGQSLMPVSRAAAGIGAGLIGLGYKATQTADDLLTLSQQTGLTTEEIQKMKYASDFVDVSFESMSGALRKLKKNMTGQKDTWEKLGVSVTDANGNMRNATDVFYETLTALSQIENETERDQVAMTLFGKSADELAGIIDDGGKALKDYGDQAKELGLIMDEETLGSLNEMKNTIDSLKANVGSTLIQLGASIAKALGPTLEKVGEKIKAIAEKIRALTPEQASLILKITGIVAALAPLLIIGGKLITGIGMLLTFAPMVTSVFGFLSLKMLAIPAIIAGIIAAGVWLVRNWDTVIAWAQKMKEKVVNAITDLKDGVKAGWEQTKADAAASWESIKSTVVSVATGIWNSAVNAFNNLKSSAISIWNGIKSSITNAVNSLKSTLSSAWSNIVSTAVGKFNSLKSRIVSVFESIKSRVQSIVDSIKNLFNFNIKLPSIGGGGGGGIQAYASAYENPVVFTRPTVLATPSGFKQFGDGNGAEIVMGLNKLQELVGGTGVVINVYPAQGMDVNQLADQIQDRFVQLQKQRSLAYA